jgi:peptidoglycan hydrolase-like protein with peptidoglycan-binding domain
MSAGRAPVAAGPSHAATAGAAEAGLGGGPGKRRRFGGRWRVLAGAAAMVAAAAAVVVMVVWPSEATPGRGAGAVQIATGMVTRGTLVSRTAVNATLGYVGSYQVINQAAGTYTALPEVGRVIRDGQVLYRVDRAPVVLLYGRVPASRALSEGTRGPDVRQLNHDLVVLGYADRADIAGLGWGYFGWDTTYAVQRLQAHLGVPQTGTAALGQVVFLPSAVRVTTVSATLGGSAAPGAPALTGTSTARLVTIGLAAAQQSYVRAGDKVTITLPDLRTTPGVVTSVGTVATQSPGSADATIPVQVKMLDPAAAGGLDQAPVQVLITTARAPNALAVPVTALLAAASGGYRVEVVGPAGHHHLVPVALGLFDDAAGLVQVTGPGLRAGQKVVEAQT